MTRATQPTRILVVGNGGREHALVWKLSAEPGVNDVFVTAASDAMLGHPHVRRVDADATDPSAVVAAARATAAELVVVGPEAPLAAGVVDALIAAGVRTFGPTAAAARIETSKAFCREVAAAAGVPMAAGRSFADAADPAAARFAEGIAAGGGGVVLKADGLAAGKGVIVCGPGDDPATALATLAGPVVVEERLVGREASVIALADGSEVLALPAARDHKRLGDGDTGPNTGGMGAYSPLRDLPDDAVVEIVERFHRPVLAELARRGTPFRGALYAGLMLTADGPRLLEFNARFGDPETQAILPRLAMPLGPLLAAAAAGSLAPMRGALADPARVPALSIPTAAIVLASAGYPAVIEVGATIPGLGPDGQLPGAPDVLVFHSGTSRDATGDGQYVATGGRVLTVVGRGRTLEDARAAAEAAAERIGWPGHQRRHDIAADATRVAA